jgi:predicted transcriptional regulator of viral defense system
VKTVNRYEDVKRIFESQGGIATTADMLRERVHSSYIARLLDEGHIARIKRGVYEWLSEGSKDDLEIIARLLPESTICMESALHYYGYIDRAPSVWHVAVNKHINKKKIKLAYPPIKVHFWVPRILDLGAARGEVGGAAIRIYDRDRTICDVTRHSTRIDREILNQAIRAYASDPRKNIRQLMLYATALRIQRKVERLVGMWLW